MTTAANELLVQGEKLFAAHLLDASALCFAKARDLGDAFQSMLGLARVRLAEGKLVEATKLLDGLTSKHPTEGEPQTYRGVVEERRGDLQAALVHYAEGARKSPQSAVARYNFGRALGQQKRWSDAIRELHAAVELQPTNAQYLYTLGTVLQGSGRTAEALEVFGRCVSHGPDFLDGYVTLADLLVFVGQDDLADQLLAAAEARLPKASAIYSKRAAICGRRNDVPGAIAHLERQVQAVPDEEHGWLALAVYRLMLLQFDAAEAAAKKALGVNPRSGQAHYQLGVIYDACRLKELAKAKFKKAIEYSPDFWKPYNNLGTMLLEEKSPASTAAAAKLFEQARDRAKGADRIAPTYNLALAYWTLGRKAESERCAREAAAGPAGNRTAEDARKFLANF